jgi:hypothetical protein
VVNLKYIFINLVKKIEYNFKIQSLNHQIYQIKKKKYHLKTFKNNDMKH